MAALALGVLAVLLVELGLVMTEGGRTLWSRVPLWAAFATAAAVLGLAAGPRSGRAARGRGRATGVGGLAGLAVFWLLVVLPDADTDRGFVLTAALACLGGSLWLTAGRRPTRTTAAEPSPDPEPAGSLPAEEPATAAAGSPTG